MALYGEHLTLSDPALNTSTTVLPQKLNTTRVLVNGAPAPLYYAGYGQINFQMPFETAVGDAVIQVERDGVLGNRISAHVVDIAPRVLLYSGTQYGIVVNNSDSTFALPSTYPNSRPAKSGEAIVIYLIGGGITDPAPVTGEAVPYPPLHYMKGGVNVSFGQNTTQAADFGGATPGFVGLYQVNVVVPDLVPRGDSVPIFVYVGDKQSKRVNIAIQ